MIEDYSFGQITVNGSRYDTDVVIYPDGHVDHAWWREDGHKLAMEDLADLVRAAPEWIIAGTGAYGAMVPDPTLKDELLQMGIQFEALPTHEAVQLYNDLCESAHVGACLHLTC